MDERKRKEEVKYDIVGRRGRKQEMAEEKEMMKKKQMDMTSGSIVRLIIAFSIPLLLGNIFQQLYNMVDSWVVGNFVSNEAFSAVGTVGPIVNMLIGFFMGLSNGAGVVISQFFGARKYEEVSKAVHTTMIMTFAMSAVLTIAGVVLTPLMLRLMNVPTEVYSDAETYLNIYFSGVSGLLFYNAAASIMQAVGDSKKPFYFLATAAVLNIIGDLVLVIVFHMGVAGVAWATILSQFVSAILSLLVLARTKLCVRISLHEMHMDWNLLKKIFRIGIPAALQMTIISFSNVFVQSYINYFGADCMSGWTAYTKSDALMFLPMQSIALAVTTFVGQNIGIGNAARAKQGIHTATIMAMICTLVLMIPTIIAAPYLVAFFNARGEVVYFGTLFLRWLTPFYFTACSNQILAAALRGSGDAKAPMLIMIFSFVIARQIYLFIVTKFISNTALSVGLSYPFGWMLCTGILLWYYRHTNFGGQSVTRE